MEDVRKIAATTEAQVYHKCRQNQMLYIKTSIAYRTTDVPGCTTHQSKKRLLVGPVVGSSASSFSGIVDVDLVGTTATALT